ncbi:MAG TPA: RHS repeat-associated core domain-containing protein, partial [Polyangiaceae bacterium]|nr:RHS repeat-associated core domain-containing protein [Polyangiaceae bacterium]
ALLAVCNGQSANCDNATTKYWKLVQTDQGRRPSVEQFGDGSITTKSYYAIGDSAPECQTNLPGVSCFPGRLKSIVTTQSPGSTGEALSFIYHYDRNGNVGEMDTPASSTTYEYDGFDRLHLANAPAGNVEYGYDAIGNLTSQTALGLYSYPPAGSAWPHAVQSVDGTSFTYDANGNQIKREGNAIPGGYQHIDYNDFSMPYRVASSEDPNAPATTLEYTADQTRAAKRSPTATTLYVGELYDRTVSNGAGVVSHHYKVYAGGQLVAQVTKEESGGAISNTETRFIHGDALGSTRLVAGGSSPELRDFDAFGKPTSALDESSTSSGFAGHEHDGELGFINMRGRLYDPRVGRFITPDPFVVSFNAQDLNRYSYVRNNPMKYVDPSGFLVHLGGWGAPGSGFSGDKKGGGTGNGDPGQNISSDGALDLTGLVEYHGSTTGTAPSAAGGLGGATANGSSSGDWDGPAPDWGSASPGTGAPTSRLHDNRLAAGGPEAPEPPQPRPEPDPDPKGETKPEEDDPIDPDQGRIDRVEDLPPELFKEWIHRGISIQGPTYLTAPGEAAEPEGTFEGPGEVDGSFKQCTEPPIEFFHGTTEGGATSILANKILPVSKNTAPFPAGSFFVHLGPEGQVAASHWAASRAGLFGDSPALLRGTMAPELFNAMVTQGLIQTGDVPGLPFFPPQTVILPQGLDAANGGIQWSFAPLTF